jgi:hypothetical protein
VEFIPVDQVVEVRLDEEQQVIARVSEATLRYMYRYGLELEHRLRCHGRNLGYFAEDEGDLFEAMRLATRLNTVEKNIRRTGRRNERLRSELVRRESGVVASRGEREGDSRFTYVGEHASKEWEETAIRWQGETRVALL